MMKLLFWKHTNPNCEFDDCCNCGKKETMCEYCEFYYWIDCGSGYCRALPIPAVVAWCKDICSLYSKGE